MNNFNCLSGECIKLQKKKKSPGGRGTHGFW